MLDAKAPPETSLSLPIEDWRALVDKGGANLPIELRLEVVGRDVAPGWAAEAGDFANDFKTAYTSFQIVWADRMVVIGGAMTRRALAEFSQGSHEFFPDANRRMLAAMEQADIVTITHEHPDHVFGIAWHEKPEALAPRLKLLPEHFRGIAHVAPGSELPAAYQRLETWTLEGPEQIAPGLVAIPMPGHSPGSVVYFICTRDGAEYLIVGDIVWTMSNLDSLKTRPRLLQYVLFDPDEERDVVLEQVRALHNLRNGNPELVFIPSHDFSHLERLMKLGLLKSQFRLLDQQPLSDREKDFEGRSE